MARKKQINPSGLNGSDRDYETPDVLSISSRENMRQRLEGDIQAFLTGGGGIDEIAPNITAQPPSRPVTNYGSRPI